MNPRLIGTRLSFLVACVAMAGACSAQPPTSDTQKQIDALRAQVNAMQKDLDEIKALLAPLRARQSPTSASLDLGSRPVRGAAGATLVMVELTDYQ